jgi:hypothetical protein
MSELLSIIASVLLVPGFVTAQGKPGATATQGLKVEKAVVATSVENREPVGENQEFDASVGTVYCWTKIAAQTPPATIKHVWYAGDQKVFEKALEIKYPSTRTWSAKSVSAGNWRVDVTDDSNTVLSSVAFTVK